MLLCLASYNTQKGHLMNFGEVISSTCEIKQYFVTKVSLETLKRPHEIAEKWICSQRQTFL